MVDHPGMEICGLLGGVGGVVSDAIPIPNIAVNPGKHFEMDPQSQVDGMLQLEQYGKVLLGIYHSHPPGSRSDPSPIDVNQWAYPDAACVIILSRDDNSIGRLRAFGIKSLHVEEIPIIQSS
jgi:proteasome lid subunit RPN8/RPN11